MNKGRTFTKGWVANAGDQIHFRTPIKGNPDNGFVQTATRAENQIDFEAKLPRSWSKHKRLSARF